MSLTTCTISGGIRWSQEKTNTGFAASKQGPDNLIDSVSPPVATVNQIFAESRTIAASASYTYDLQALTNFFGEAVVLTKARALHLGVSGSTVKLEPGAADPATWFFGGTTPSISLPDGSFITIGWNTNYTVSATAKTLKITNTGATSATIQIAIVGGL